MLVGICDFPGSYAFPPAGYGGIERWLWATAIGAGLAGADVHLIGPAWQQGLEPDWTIRPVRLEDTEPGSRAAAELRDSRYDLLIVGHEYPSLRPWRRISDELGCDVATFQHHPDFRQAPDAFDGGTRRLFCYSAEMADRYAAHRPIRELAVHLGLGEKEPAAVDGRDLVWVGRLDEEKSPHLAAKAAGLLGRRIRFVGPVFDDDYMQHHAVLFGADHVEMVGELGGVAKTAAFASAAAFVYTCSRTYVEAGVATLGEALRAGTPVAALVWREGTCADAALCADTGMAVTADPDKDDDQAAEALAEAIEQAARLSARSVQEVGLGRFDPKRHFTALAIRP